MSELLRTMIPPSWMPWSCNNFRLSSCSALARVTGTPLFSRSYSHSAASSQEACSRPTDSAHRPFSEFLASAYSPRIFKILSTHYLYSTIPIITSVELWQIAFVSIRTTPIELFRNAFALPWVELVWPCSRRLSHGLWPCSTPDWYYPTQNRPLRNSSNLGFGHQAQPIQYAEHVESPAANFGIPSIVRTCAVLQLCSLYTFSSRFVNVIAHRSGGAPIHPYIPTRHAPTMSGQQKLTKKQKKALAFRDRKGKGKPQSFDDLDDVPVDENQDCAEVELDAEADDVEAPAGRKAGAKKGAAQDAEALGDGDRGKGKKRKREEKPEGDEEAKEDGAGEKNTKKKRKGADGAGVAAGDAVGEDAKKADSKKPQGKQRFILFVGECQAGHTGAL